VTANKASALSLNLISKSNQGSHCISLLTNRQESQTAGPRAKEAADGLTAVAVSIAAAVARWRPQWILASASGVFLLMIAWRLLCNVFSFSGDFLPVISAGDVGCLLAGAIAPSPGWSSTPRNSDDVGASRVANLQ